MIPEFPSLRCTRNEMMMSADIQFIIIGHLTELNRAVSFWVIFQMCSWCLWIVTLCFCLCSLEFQKIEIYFFLIIKNKLWRARRLAKRISQLDLPILILKTNFAEWRSEVPCLSPCKGIILFYTSRLLLCLLSWVFSSEVIWKSRLWCGT